MLPSNPPEHPQWRPLLVALEKAGFGRGYIAGGAARDATLDKDPKDIDVFLPDIGYILEPRRLKIEDFCKANGAQYERGANSAYFPGSTRDLTTVHTISWPGLHCPVQLIGLYPWGLWDAKFVLSRIDFGLCKVAFSVDGWEFDLHFLEDATTYSMTLVRCDNWQQFRASAARYMRLLDKYPYKFVFQDEVIPVTVIQRYLNTKTSRDLHVVSNDRRWVSHIEEYSEFDKTGVTALAARLGY